MVIRKEQVEEEVKPEVKEVVKDEETNQIPMIPNYLDLILGEVNAIRLLLEQKQN